MAVLSELPFPASKEMIVKYAKRYGTPDYAIALFEGLNGYIEYRDLHHL